jgi:hypothetical protein
MEEPVNPAFVKPSHGIKTESSAAGVSSSACRHLKDDGSDLYPAAQTGKQSVMTQITSFSRRKYSWNFYLKH